VTFASRSGPHRFALFQRHEPPRVRDDLRNSPYRLLTNRGAVTLRHVGTRADLDGRMIKKLIWLGVITLGGSGIYYQFHPAAKSCEALIHASNSAVNAANKYQPGDDIYALLDKIDSASEKLLNDSNLRPPFATDAALVGADLASIAGDIRAGNTVGLYTDIGSFNSAIGHANADCRGATSGVSGG
jgi:hypothetical protein